MMTSMSKKWLQPEAVTVVMFWERMFQLVQTAIVIPQSVRRRGRNSSAAVLTDGSALGTPAAQRLAWIIGHQSW